MENQKVTQLGRKLKLACSVGVLAIFLLLTAYTDNLTQREFFKALAIVACLNMFRVITNNHIIKEK